MVARETRQKSLQNNRLPGLALKANVLKVIHWQCSTLWCQLEDTFQLIVTPQGMELVMVHIEVISQCLKKYRVEYKACYIFLLDTIQL